ncbi:MAG: DUF484 family protein [Magnetococcales bacterium]|nr:DUF484 family protein [Magnetococcales bacterium]
MDISPSLDDAQVLAWLQQHPDFFARHPEMLPAAIHASGKILSLEAGQLNHLRRQNDQLREKLDAILERLLRNEEIYRAFHAIQTRLIMATLPWSLIATVTQEPEGLFNIFRVTVTLSEQEEALVALFRHAPPPDSLAERLFVLPHARLVQAVGTGTAPMIRVGREGHDRTLYFGQRAESIRSEALVPLYVPEEEPQAGGRRLIGSLNLGGETPNRFLPSDATDLLQDLANVFGLCLIRHTDSPAAAAPANDSA